MKHEDMLIEVINMYVELRIINIYGIALGGKGCTKMMDPTLQKKDRKTAILIPYPIRVRLDWGNHERLRFIPWR